MEIDLKGLKIGKNHPCFIVAEMSANHGGSFEKAKRIIKAAKESGADAIKLQTYTADTITIKSDLKDFKIRNDSPWSNYKNLWELYNNAHTPFDWHYELFEFAKSIGIEIFSTPFDSTAVDLLEDLNVKLYKIASPEIINIPLLEKVGSTKKPVILSTGVCNDNELRLAIKTLKKSGTTKIAVLKCTTSYPAPIDEINLKTLKYYKDDLKVITGISDHTLDNNASICSICFGGKIIEKHFIDDYSIETPDSFFSLDKFKFEKLVKDIRDTELMIGKIVKTPSKSSKKSIKSRPSIYPFKKIKKGDVLSLKNLKVVRPGYSLNPSHLSKLLGKTSLRDFNLGERISLKDIK